MPDQKVELRVGLMVKDNDPRQPNRIMRIHGFDGKGRAILRMPSERLGQMGETRIAINRIYLDKKPRRSGWNILDD